MDSHYWTKCLFEAELADAAALERASYVEKGGIARWMKSDSRYLIDCNGAFCISVVDTSRHDENEYMATTAKEAMAYVDAVLAEFPNDETDVIYASAPRRNPAVETGGYVWYLTSLGAAEPTWDYDVANATRFDHEAAQEIVHTLAASGQNRRLHASDTSYDRKRVIQSKVMAEYKNASPASGHASGPMP